MALPIISISSFKGPINISQSATIATDLTQYINSVRDQMIKYLLGHEAFRDIRDATKDKWTDLFAGSDYEDGYGKQYTSKGMTAALRYFIYFAWLRDDFMNSEVGNVLVEFESAKAQPKGQNFAVLQSKYNAGVEIMNDEVYHFIKCNLVRKTAIINFTQLSDDGLQLDVFSTKYLYVGDKLNVMGEEYVVSEVVDNVSITIENAKDLLPVGYVYWEPFNMIKATSTQPIVL